MGMKFPRAFLFLSTLSTIVLADTYVPCDQDKAKQTARSRELQRIVAADQSDRKVIPMPAEVFLRDRQRRERVGQIFGEGCFTTAADYAAAALVYQHGDRPDHFLQTFHWAKRSFELGDANQKRLMALGLDRYLVNVGHKQLFASQANKVVKEMCWCLEPLESTFPEAMRKDYMSTSLAEQLAWIDGLNKGTACPPAKECAHDLKPTPRGTVPGFW